MEQLSSIVACGIVATVLVDLWSLVRRRLFGTALPNYLLVGRWIAQFPRGRFRHESIAAVAPTRGEGWIGWATHYLIGIAFAFLLFAAAGRAWFEQPALTPALLVGIATVAAPFFIMQPAMGAGIAAGRTSRPGASRLQSLVTHVFFGIGLYAGGLLNHQLYSGV